MMKNLCFLIASGILIFTFANVGRVSAQEEIRYNDEIEPYVSFLRKQSQQPVDYVIGLFEKSDIVILCERSHGEITQYDLIYDIISDERFIDQIGILFTEIGSSTMNDFVHDFMFTDGLSNDEIEKKVLYIYRNLYWVPIWEKYNFFDFLTRLYSLNNSLTASMKIDIYFSDMPFSWEGMTEESYLQFCKTLDQRDQVMAYQIIERFNKILESPQKRKKALVIMNYRHSFNDFRFADGKKGDNVGRYIFEAFPGKVSNVMINSLALLPGSTDQETISTPIHNGKWDAAFEVVGNPRLGFDFISSPFGKDYFDYFTFRKHNLKYQDVFTGFIFYKPLKEHKQIFGIPNLFGDGYDQIILDRMAIFGKTIEEHRAPDFIKEQETLKEFTYKSLSDITEKISRWFIEFRE